MNTTLARHETQHPPQQTETVRPVRRVGFVDRLALRVGLALVVWGSRTVRTRVRSERRATSAEQDFVRPVRHDLPSIDHYAQLLRNR